MYIVKLNGFFILMEGNDLEKTLPVGTSNCPIFEGG